MNKKDAVEVWLSGLEDTVEVYHSIKEYKRLWRGDIRDFGAP